MKATKKVRRTRKSSGLPVGKVIRGLMGYRKAGHKYASPVALIRLVRRYATA